MVEVVAALIRKDNKFMICRRPEWKSNALLWEFVGGKVEAGETKEEALIRECKEELNIVIEVGKPLTDVVHTYPDITIHLTLFSATVKSGEIILNEHCDMKWISRDEISDYEFCLADKEILEFITKLKD